MFTFVSMTGIALLNGSHPKRAKNRIVEGLHRKGLAGLLALSLFSCSYTLAPTTAQKEQKKFERFKVSPNEALIYSGTVFLGYSMGKHYIKSKD